MSANAIITMIIPLVQSVLEVILRAINSPLKADDFEISIRVKTPRELLKQRGLTDEEIEHLGLD